MENLTFLSIDNSIISIYTITTLPRKFKDGILMKKTVSLVFAVALAFDIT